MGEHISDRIRELLKLNNKKQKDLAEYMGIEYQAFRNKMQRGSFTAEELIKIGQFCNADLSYTCKRGTITLTT